MGKCLSCCEQPDDASGGLQSKQKGGGVGTAPAVDDSNGLGGSLSHDDAALQRGRDNNHGHPNQQSNDNDLEQKNKNSVGSGEKPSRNMFYPRIPPILAVGGDSKWTSHNKEFSESKILAFYEQYRDSHEDAILSEGIEKLCLDLEVRPEEFKVLVLAWKFKAETMCRFSRAEFVNGCKTLKVCSAKGIQSRFPEMLREVEEDPEKFKDLYRFTFSFGLDAEVGQRILPADMAVLLWRLVFSQKEPPLLSRWLAFLECHPNVRGVPRDTWNMFLNFLEAVGDDLGQYDDAEAWPSLFDDFVDYVRYENDQTNQNVVVQRKDDNELRIF